MLCQYCNKYFLFRITNSFIKTEAKNYESKMHNYHVIFIEIDQQQRHNNINFQSNARFEVMASRKQLVVRLCVCLAVLAVTT